MYSPEEFSSRLDKSMNVMGVMQFETYSLILLRLLPSLPYQERRQSFSNERILVKQR